MKTYKQLVKEEILKEHNIPTYQLIEEFFQEDGKRIGLVQATGTGKSFITIQMLKDFCFLQNGKKALYLTSQKPIIQQVESHLKDVGLATEENLQKVDRLIYKNLLSLGDEEISLLQYDYIILDEFHRIGAEEWGKKVQTLLAKNPKAKVLGLSATPIRYLDNGRDMAKELFGENVIEGMTLREAVEQGVLPRAEYHMGVYSYAADLEGIRQKILKIQDKERREKLTNWVQKAKRRIEVSDGLEDVFAKNIKNKNGKFVAFCIDHEKLKEIKEKIEKGMLSKVNSDVKIYEVSYADGAKKVAKTIQDFENDESSSLKIMLSVDMFNEGLHIKGIDGCMMFRPTTSPRIYLQQLGRALSVDGTKTPVIFDIVNNATALQTIGEIFIKDEERAENPYALEEFLPFHIDSKNLEISKLLLRLDEIASFYSTTTEQYLHCARRYAKIYGNLDMNDNFRDKETNVGLGVWLARIRRKYIEDKTKVSTDIVKALIEIDPKVFEYTVEHKRAKKEEKILKYAKAYFDKHGNLAVPIRLKITENDGETVFPFGQEMSNIRKFIKQKKSPNMKKQTVSVYSNHVIEELLKIDPRFNEEFYADNLEREEREANILKYARAYFEKEGHLAVPFACEMVDEKTGEIFLLGRRISELKQFLLAKEKGEYYSRIYSEEVIRELLALDPRVFEENYGRTKYRELKEAKMLKFAQDYFEKHGNLAIPVTPKAKKSETSDAEFDFGIEISTMRRYIKQLKQNDGKKLVSNIYSQEFLGALIAIDPRVFEESYYETYSREVRESTFARMANEFFLKNGHLAIKKNDVIIDPETGNEYPIGPEFVDIKKYVKVQETGEGKITRFFTKALIDYLRALDPRVFEYNYSGNLAREKKEAKIVEASEMFFKENGHLAVPQNCVIKLPKTGEEFKLGYEFVQIKQFAKGNRATGYSKTLIDTLLKIDSRIFEKDYAEVLAREKKEEKILKFAKGYFKKHGNLAVQLPEMVFDEETKSYFKLGEEFNAIKDYVKGKGNSVYSDSLIKSLKEIDSRVYEEDYSGNLEREERDKKILRCAKVFYEKYGCLAVMQKESVIDPLSGEEVFLGHELSRVRSFVNGKGKLRFSKELIEQLKEIDPQVFDENYTFKSGRAKNGKGKE